MPVCFLRSRSNAIIVSAPLRLRTNHLMLLPFHSLFFGFRFVRFRLEQQHYSTANGSRDWCNIHTHAYMCEQTPTDHMLSLSRSSLIIVASVTDDDHVTVFSPSPLTSLYVICNCVHAVQRDQRSLLTRVDHIRAGMIYRAFVIVCVCLHHNRCLFRLESLIFIDCKYIYCSFAFNFRSFI